MKKNKLIFGMFLLICILLAGFISAIDVSYCCERLKNNGAWCQNALQSECATGTSYKAAPTSCESTSYCRLGTCINIIEGTCSPSTPQQLCNSEGGIWKEEEPEDLPQCQLGCCLMGEQAAYVTQTRCKRLSSVHGLETDYRTDITNELECIASATSDEKGACVFERDYEVVCLMLTQKQCNELGASATLTGVFKNYFGSDASLNNIDAESISFHKGYLCSATSLGTNCGPRGGTTCVEGEDVVYFLDTCGNLANVYDYSKLNNENYWTYIQDSLCDDKNGNKDSRTCGECDYYSGSTCKNYRDAGTSKPFYGESVCGSLDCGWYDTDMDGREDANEYYEHGEKWCITNNKKGLGEKNLPGTRYFVLECRDGEIITEPCAEFRQEICIESELAEDYSNAGCVVNKWQDCVNQSNKEDCEDDYERDCYWIEGYSLKRDQDGKSLTVDENKDAIEASCVPKYSPGFDFYANEGHGAEICSLASSSCTAKYEVGITRSRKKQLEEKELEERIEYCVENCYCIPGYKKGDAKKETIGGEEIWRRELRKDGKEVPFDSYDEWIGTMNSLCTALGDCGNKINYLDVQGEVKEVFDSFFVKKA